MTKNFFLTQRVSFLRFLRFSFLRVGLFIFFLVSFGQAATSGDKPCDPSVENNFISVYLDFPYHTRFIRESLPVMNYVRDRQNSQVHIKISRHHAGSAGVNYVINLIGRQQFEGMNNEITYWDPSTNSSDDTRRGLLERLKLGLAPYLANTSMDSQIAVHIPDSLTSNGNGEMDDPWHHWVFELYGGANFYKESTQ